MPRPPLPMQYLGLTAVVALGILLLTFALPQAKPIISPWGVQNDAAALAGRAEQQAAPTIAPSPITGIAQAQGVGQVALDNYVQASAVQEDVGEGRVRFFRRDVAGGALDFFVVRLDQQVTVRTVNADGATPGSDTQGDTVWADGQRHLRTVQEMTTAPYAARDGSDLLGAIAFGFHGEPRTANEGTVVIDGQVLRSNPGRGTLCITGERKAEIGKFATDDLKRCQQAFGGGPVILWENKVANPDAGAATDEFLPFNPLGEDFVQLDWRKQIYTGRYPKTAIGIGLLANGESYLVLANAHNMLGIDFARQLRDMGCYAALGGDDDTSTQAVWRGQLTRPRAVRAVPDAISIYLRKP